VSSKTWALTGRYNNGVVVSNSTGDMGVRTSAFFCVVFSCVGRGLATG
jgi:hypothetical protein